jgi:hypothetical protein
VSSLHKLSASVAGLCHGWCHACTLALARAESYCM